MKASRIRHHLTALAAGIAFVISPMAASAGLMDSAISMAAPLAEKFGVPADLVTSLLDGGFDLETVVQSLLVDQAADSVGLGDIADQLKGGADISSIASGLGVDPEVYASDKVDAVISDLSGGASDAAGDAADQASDAAEDAGKKADEMIKGLGGK